MSESIFIFFTSAGWSIFPTAFTTLIFKVNEFLKYFGAEFLPGHVGNLFVLPPDESNPDAKWVWNPKAYYDGMGLFDLDVFDWFDKEKLASAHSMETHLKKVKKMLDESKQEGSVLVDGFASGVACNEDEECKHMCFNGWGAGQWVCASKELGDWCYNDNDCESKRCDPHCWTCANQKCYQKLPTGEPCNEHSDCTNGYCGWFSWKCN